MPVRQTRKRKDKIENEEQANETYSKKLRRKMVQASKKTENNGNDLQELPEISRTKDSYKTENNGCELQSEISKPVENSCGNQHTFSHGDQHLFTLQPRQQVPTIHGFTPLAYRSQNLVHFLQQYTGGQKTTVKLKQSLSSTVVNLISDLSLCRNASPFDRRVTCMEWHPTNPNILAVGSKGGDIILWDTVDVKKDRFIQGIGPGGNIQALKFWPNDNDKIVASALDGRVTVHDLEGRQSQILADTLNFYDFWYCSVDVNAKRKLVVAGDNTGNTQLLSYEGKQVFNSRLHKNKVTHIEFSPREEWLLCTASTDQTVQFWDIRNLKDRKSSLHVLKHDKPINSAYFSYTDGCRLLTTDQNEQVRVYQAPTWELERTIKHPHRFFQHITPIKATWHPLQDLAVIGRYPDPKFPGYYEGELRTIDILDVESGDLVTSVSDSTVKGLCCVNKFNRRGDVLASGMSSQILLWTRKEEILERQSSLLTTMKAALDNSNHGNTGSNRRPRGSNNKKTKGDPPTKQKMETKTKERKSKEQSEAKNDKEKLKLKLKNSKK